MKIQEKWRALFEMFCKGAAFIIASTYIYQSFLANSDLRDGRHVLFMDELITYDSVQIILTAKSILTVFGGNLDLRYGSILFFVSAIFALPAKIIGGVPLEILAIRTALVVELLASYAILSYLLVRNRLISIVLFAVLITLPSTSYYSSMPKPEPLQLLFISLFLYFIIVSGDKFRFSWLFLGLAFGAKISAILLVPFAILYALLRSRHKNISNAYSHLLGASSLFSFGWLISNTVVLRKGGFSRYVGATFQNTTHGADSSDINFLSWLQYFYQDYLSSPSLIKLAFLISLFPVILLSVYNTVCHYRQNKDSKIKAYLSVDGVFISVLGLASIAAIMISVQRLWGFYLHVGLVLTIVGAAKCAEENLKMGTLRQVNYFFIIALITMLPFQYFDAKAKFLYLSVRSDTNVAKLNSLAFNELSKFLVNLEENGVDRARIGYDPYLYLPENSPVFEFVRFYGDYDDGDWASSNDFIITQCKSIMGITPNWDDITVVDDCIPELPNYIKAHLDIENGCTAAPCYSIGKLGAAEHVMVASKISESDN